MITLKLNRLEAFKLHVALNGPSSIDPALARIYYRLEEALKPKPIKRNTRTIEGVQFEAVRRGYGTGRTLWMLKHVPSDQVYHAARISANTQPKLWAQLEAHIATLGIDKVVKVATDNR